MSASQDAIGLFGNQSSPKWATRAREIDLLIVRTLTEVPEWWVERILPKVERDEASGCLLWLGARDSKGYGASALPRAIAPRGPRGGVMVKVHRVAWILEHDGPVLYGLTLDHLCRVRNCVEPAHLEAVPIRTNILRGDTLAADLASRTHCPRGHLLAGDNLIPSNLARGKRACLTCGRERNAAQTATVSAAHKALDLTWSDYTATFGSSRTTAERVLDSLSRGIRPEVLISGARAAIEATQREAGAA